MYITFKIIEYCNIMKYFSRCIMKDPIISGYISETNLQPVREQYLIILESIILYKFYLMQLLIKHFIIYFYAV